jgi:hypothetical protein
MMCPRRRKSGSESHFVAESRLLLGRLLCF